MTKRPNTTLTAARRQAAIDPTFWRCRDTRTDARKLRHIVLAFFDDHHAALYVSAAAAQAAGAEAMVELKRGMRPDAYLQMWAELIRKRPIEPRALPVLMAAIAHALSVPLLCGVLKRAA